MRFLLCRNDKTKQILRWIHFANSNVNNKQVFTCIKKDADETDCCCKTLIKTDF
jgi:hypothetical protein